MQNKKIVFLASDCESSRWVYNACVKDFEFVLTIIENPVSKKTLFKARLKRLGFAKVFGQAMFSALMVPLLKIKAKNRKVALLKEYGLKNTAFDTSRTHYVESVNDDTCKRLLQQIEPDIVIVNGTRIIKKSILRSTNAVFVNMHVGITPLYRGSHGGYWALYNHDENNFGTTIHLVDPGVDTGAVLEQVFTKPAKEDNFTTYPILQTIIGIEALKKIIPELINGTIEAKTHTKKGKIYYQPTIWQYVLNLFN